MTVTVTAPVRVAEGMGQCAAHTVAKLERTPAKITDKHDKDDKLTRYQAITQSEPLASPPARVSPAARRHYSWTALQTAPQARSTAVPQPHKRHHGPTLTSQCRAHENEQAWLRPGSSERHTRARVPLRPSSARSQGCACAIYDQKSRR